MIIKTGIDITSVDRIEKVYNKKKERFLNKILTKVEQEHIYNKDQTINLSKVAKRFAAKEAFSKCLGTGIGYISFLDIEVLSDSFKAPYIRLSEKAIEYLKREKKWQNPKIELSLSDDANMTIAIVIIYNS